jgi:hypothetical protein
VLVVPVGAVVVGVLAVVVLGGLAAVVVAAGGEVNVGPADAGKPTLPELVVGGRFGAGRGAGCRPAGVVV